jgi:hypothetical protein
MEIVGTLLLVLIIIFGAAKNWKLAIKSILVIVIIEGALRRWAFPQARDLIYFFKDFILVGSYIGFASQPRPLVDRYPLIKEITLVISILCTLQAFNPSLGSPIIGFLGVKFYLLYIPLIWVIPHLFDSEKDLQSFLQKYLLLLIPVCILGIAQYFSPPDSVINVYSADGAAANASVGDFVRITGTFSYLAGHTAYLAICFSLLIVLISREKLIKWQVIYSIELILVIANSFMSGARFIIVYESLFIVSYILLLFFNSPKVALTSIKRLFVILTIATITAIVYFQPAIQAFSDRATNSDSVEERIFESFTQVGSYANIRLDGYGTGATQAGANSLRSLLELPAGEELPPSEGETGRVIIEIGMIGFILWYGLRIILLISIFSVFLRLKNPFYKQLALAIFLFQSINLTGQLVTNPTMVIYFWFFSGFIYLLPILEEKEILRID